MPARASPCFPIAAKHLSLNQKLQPPLHSRNRELPTVGRSQNRVKSQAQRTAERFARQMSYSELKPFLYLSNEYP